MSYIRDAKGKFIKGFSNPLKKEPFKKNCEWCGVEYSKKPSRARETRFCSRSCKGSWFAQHHLNKNIETRDYRRDKNPFWKGGYKIALGYKLILMPEHPKASKQGYIQEHRVVMERYLGRALSDIERIHHINGIRDDNKIENLLLCETQSEHVKLHRKGGRWQTLRK